MRRSASRGRAITFLIAADATITGLLFTFFAEFSNAVSYSDATSLLPIEGWGIAFLTASALMSWWGILVTSWPLRITVSSRHYNCSVASMQLGLILYAACCIPFAMSIATTSFIQTHGGALVGTSKWTLAGAGALLLLRVPQIRREE